MSEDNADALLTARQGFLSLLETMYDARIIADPSQEWIDELKRICRGEEVESFSVIDEPKRSD